MDDGVKSGLKTVVAEEFDAGAAVPGSVDAFQLPLLPLPQMIVAQEAAEHDGSTAGRGAGRPAGSKNKNTEAWRNFILGRYQSPLVAMAETFNRTLQQLAEDLGYLVRYNGHVLRRPTPDEMLELLKIQMQCAKELAPYVHSKQPIAIDAGDRGLMQLIINTGMATANQVENAGVMAVNFLPVAGQSDQGLTGDIVQNSDVTNSDAEQQRIETERQSDDLPPD